MSNHQLTQTNRIEIAVLFRTGMSYRTHFISPNFVSGRYEVRRYEMGSVDLSDEANRVEVGGIVHDAWLSRNERAKGGELDVPFDQLIPEEQAKDISQIKVAQRIFNPEQ